MEDNDKATVGEKNVEFVLKFLELENIPVNACSVGGDYARKIFYFVSTREVFLEKIKKSEYTSSKKQTIKKPKTSISIFKKNR